MVYHYHDDAPDVVMIGDTRRRARKEHRCDTCPLGGPPSSAFIPVGQEYRRVTGTQDGEFFTYRSCVGPCPHMVPCASCGGTGQINAPQWPQGDPCPSCDGVGKARAAITGVPANG